MINIAAVIVHVAAQLTALGWTHAPIVPRFAPVKTRVTHRRIPLRNRPRVTFGVGALALALLCNRRQGKNEHRQ